MITSKLKLIEKIEGEAKLNFSFQDDKIDFVDIQFLQTRSIEKLLQGKNALDALVINPRVCGICGHAHLIATVKALENCYDTIEISQKAEIIRELTLNFELIQNHFKWFYLTIYPFFEKKQDLFKAMTPSQTMSKAIATIAGQYPHNSYAIVGGVVCDLTNFEIVKVMQYIDEVIEFFEQNVVVAQADKFLQCNNVDTLLSRDGDLPNILHKIQDNGWIDVGKSYDRFIVFGENSYFKSGKSIKTRLTKHLYFHDILESTNENSLAKNVQYKDKFYEVGPLSRAMLNRTPLIKDSHRKFGDSMFSRILARMCEILQLLNHSKQLLNDIDLTQPSFIKPSDDISKLESSGVGAVEAARGSLIHKVEIENKVIKKYDIITPTQWNLSNGTKDNLGVSQKSMIGLEDIKLAELSFKSYDVCSVCTTH